MKKYVETTARSSNPGPISPSCVASNKFLNLTVLPSPYLETGGSYQDLLCRLAVKMKWDNAWEESRYGKHSRNVSIFYTGPDTVLASASAQPSKPQ